MFAAEKMILSKDLCYYLNMLEVIEHMLWSTHLEIQIVVLQILVGRIFQNLVHLLNSIGNRDKYSMDRMSRNMPGLSVLQICGTFPCTTRKQRDAVCCRDGNPIDTV